MELQTPTTMPEPQTGKLVPSSYFDKAMLMIIIPQGKLAPVPKVGPGVQTAMRLQLTKPGNVVQSPCRRSSESLANRQLCGCESKTLGL